MNSHTCFFLANTKHEAEPSSAATVARQGQILAYSQLHLPDSKKKTRQG